MLSHRSFVFTYYMELLDFGLGWRETFRVHDAAHPCRLACLLLPVLLRQGRCVSRPLRTDLLLGTIERERATVTLAGADDDLHPARSPAA